MLEVVSAEGAYVNTNDFMAKYVSCVICQLVFGERPSSDDPDFERYINVAQELAQNTNILDNLILMIPQLKILEGVYPRLTKVVRNMEFCHEYCQRKIDEHKKRMSKEDMDGDSNDFCEAYIREHWRAEAAGQPFDEFNLVRTMFELFIAGTDTTATTLRWSLVYMALNPDVQQKVQAELDSVVGRERLPNMMDKSSLHYTNATIDEIHRICTVIPMTLGHRAMHDTQYKGYDIPSNAAVIANIYAIHHNPESFPEPQKFRPERFLDFKTGNLIFIFPKQHNMYLFCIFQPFCLFAAHCTVL